MKVGDKFLIEPDELNGSIIISKNDVELYGADSDELFEITITKKFKIITKNVLQEIKSKGK